MIALSDSSPVTNVEPAEYQRLLGYPRDHELDERALELSDEARAWYAAHARPWIYAREAQSLDIGGDRVVIDGVSFTSKRLLNTLRDAAAESVVLVAVSAGPEIEQEAQRRWLDEKPDEYFFFEVYGSAIVEHLVTTAGGRLCAVADADELAVLPHYSPGYPDWEIADQAPLFALIARDGLQSLPSSVEVLESGMLRPKKALLAVFGLTRHLDHVRKLGDLVPCENCTLPGCQYRRARYLRPRRRSEVESMRPANELPVGEQSASPLDRYATYTVNAKALRRWSGERLALDDNEDGTIDARFRYEGTTCSNTGRPFAFIYDVTLGPREGGYIIVDQRCAPAAGDEGHTFMCRYQSAAPQLMASIGEEKPLLGHALNDVLSWSRSTSGPTCYCEGDSRAQKWGVVLETIHYALVQRESPPIDAPTSRKLQSQ